MKKFILFLLLCSTGSVFNFSLLLAQRKPVPFNVVAYKAIDDPLGYANLSFSAILIVKNAQGDTLYMERHDSTLNGIAEKKLNIGKGANQSPAYDMADLSKAEFLCFTHTIHDPGGDVVIMGEDRLGQNLFTAHAAQSENTNALGNVEWGTETVEPMDLYMPPADITYSLPVTYANALNQPKFKQVDFRRYIRSRTAPSAVNAMPVDYLVVGTGNPCPWLFGYDEWVEAENFYEIWPGSMEKFHNGFAVRMRNYGEPLGRSTSACYLENIYDALGVGLYANGRSRGSYNIGQTGSLGLCNNTTGNGAGNWGYVLNDAAVGSGNYAVLGSANGRIGAYAGLFDGDVFVSGNFMNPSDRNLKTAITTSSIGLSTILKLRATSFRYQKNTSHSLPDGEHYGFIAQEVEEIMPELVHEITLPASLDPDLMSSGGTVQYKGINYLEMIPLLTKAIQELNEKVDAQAAVIAQLSKELKACSKPK